MKLLQIDSSARAGSVTRRLTAEFAEQWKANHPAGQVIHRDLSTTTLPLITDDWSAAQIQSSELSSAQRNYLSTSHRLIEEMQGADTIVIGAPMYNFAIPSLLKAWIDQIVRVGKTVAYGPNGRQGLLKIRGSLSSLRAEARMKRAVPARSSIFRNPTCATFSALSVGLTDVTFIHAENQLREGAGPSLAAAAEQIGHLVA
jgi:FMN-dependent NADH-azoreductase